MVSFYALAVPSGTTADIVVSFSQNMTRCAIAVYAVYNLQGLTPVATGEDLTLPCSFGLAVTAGDLIIAGAYSTNTSTDSWTWTNVTEDNEIKAEAGGRPTSAASLLTTVTETRTVTASASGGSVCAAAIALR
jgi:hypothetical protein